MASDARHLAGRLEDVGRRLPAALLRRWGWRPAILPYPCYGSAPPAEGGTGWVRVLARVVLQRPDASGRPEESVRGWRRFVSSPVPTGVVEVEVGGAVHQLYADRGGYIDEVVPADLPAGWQVLALRVPGCGDHGGASTDVMVVGSQRQTAILSDIDDTVMVTWLPRPFIAAFNTFVRREHARAEVPGMSALFRRLQAGQTDAAIVYLSTGAWNVAATVGRFLRRHRFPPGPLLLTDWGPTNTGWFRSGREHKEQALRRLAKEFPQVRWLLVGDDGQHDPEIYRDFAAEHPDRVRAVAIRSLTPGEQVLAHGLPIPLPTARGRRAAPGVPEVSGSDGFELMAELDRVDVL